MTVLSTIKLQQRTNLFWFGSFIFSWPIVIQCLFVFSAKTTVQWYFIIGSLFAVAVLASIVLYLWKRRIAGTYTSSNKCIFILNPSSEWKRAKILIVIIRNSTTLFCSKYSFESWHQFVVIWQWRLFFHPLLVHQNQHNKIKSTKNRGCGMKTEKNKEIYDWTLTTISCDFKMGVISTIQSWTEIMLMMWLNSNDFESQE